MLCLDTNSQQQRVGRLHHLAAVLPRRDGYLCGAVTGLVSRASGPAAGARNPPVTLRGGFAQDSSVTTTYSVRKRLKLPSESSRKLCRSWRKARQVSVRFLSCHQRGAALSAPGTRFNPPCLHRGFGVKEGAISPSFC